MPGDGLLTRTIVRSVDVVRTPRLAQVEGMFDVPPSRRSEQTWEVRLDLPESWHVGVVVGPSGSGKSTVARECFGASLVERWDWPEDRSVLDGFPAGLGIKEVVELLSSVGFSSPPAWARPYRVLSTGEKFRVDLARTLAELPDLAVVDEFSSVVDRRVAQVGSAAVAKAVRHRGRRFVAVTCHYDVIDWLDPDWIYQPHSGDFQRRSLRGRPTLGLAVHPAHHSAWSLFRHHHYLSAAIHKASTCFVACLDGEPVAFNSYLHFPHPRVRDVKVGHRLVVLPDFQGIGIGRRFEEWMGESLAARGYRYRNITGHPALIAACNKSLRWRLVRAGGKPRKGLHHSNHKIGRKMAGNANDPRRLMTVCFEYVPERARRPVAC